LKLHDVEAVARRLLARAAVPGWMKRAGRNATDPLERRSLPAPLTASVAWKTEPIRASGWYVVPT
jgi:hypothetical protein